MFFLSWVNVSVEIGTKCWLKGNLASSSDRNRDSIPRNFADVKRPSTFGWAQAINGEAWVQELATDANAEI